MYFRVYHIFLSRTLHRTPHPYPLPIFHFSHRPFSHHVPHTMTSTIISLIFLTPHSHYRSPGYDVMEWLSHHLCLTDQVELVHMASLLCKYGYIYPISDTIGLNVKDDGTLYRFQVRFNSRLQFTYLLTVLILNY